MKEVNEDEIIGYIMRKTSDKKLYYEDVRAVLDAEMDFLESKRMLEEAESINEYADPLKPIEESHMPEKAGDSVTIK